MIKKLIKRLRRFFRKIEDVTTKPPVNDYGRGDDFNPTWGIIVPHTRKAQGARTHSSIKPPIYEYGYGIQLAIYLSDRIPHKTRDTAGVYGAAKALKNLGCNATIEPHCNAYNGKAHGYEILVMAGDSLSKEYALNIISAYEAKYPERRKRQGDGVKEVKKGERGYYNLKNAKAAGVKVALLSELFFIDNTSDFMGPLEMSNFLKEVLAK
jgi:hypothetical protein